MSFKYLQKIILGDHMCSGTCVSNEFHVILERVQLISSKLFVFFTLGEVRW